MELYGPLFLYSSTIPLLYYNPSTLLKSLYFTRIYVIHSNSSTSHKSSYLSWNPCTHTPTTVLYSNPSTPHKSLYSIQILLLSCNLCTHTPTTVLYSNPSWKLKSLRLKPKFNSVWQFDAEKGFLRFSGVLSQEVNVKLVSVRSLIPENIIHPRGFLCTWFQRINQTCLR